MGYVKKIFAYLKQKKWKVIFLLSFLSLVLSFKIIADKIYIYLGNGYDRQSAELATMLDSVLGIPYRQQPHFRNDNPDIIKISQEELFTIPDPKASRIREIELEDGKHPLPIKDGLGNPLYATHRITVYKDEIHDVFNPLKLVESMPTVKEVNHANSLKVSPIFYQIRLTKPIYRQLCGNFLTCNSLNVSLREEFLQNPKMLQNIIKIAERPCDYIRTIDEIKPGDEIVYSTKRTPAGNYLEASPILIIYAFMCM